MSKNTREYSKETEWTIMIYCAGDNELAPLVVSQLKALKDAGRNDNVNVLAYFDPNEKGVPTRLYCLNQKVAYRGRNALDSWVSNMKDDDIEWKRFRGAAATEMQKALEYPDDIDAKQGLNMFLRFCREAYPAKHYALVLMGHGMIVANDAFLPDESPVSSIKLTELGETLSGFRGKLELLALHSCSMSAIEVAYELKGKANYMIASEGLSFIGGWPYRQLLLRTYSFLKNGTEKENVNENTKTAPQKQLDVRDLIERLYKLSSYNGLDFMLSGYSQDLALINLDPGKFEPLTEAMQTLVSELVKDLQDQNNTRATRAKELIQLAHLESQSYFDENYTDLYDFCSLLAEKCTSNFTPLKNACKKVMEALEPSDSKDIDERFSKIVIHSRHFGWQYQFSHGLSIYFPWSRPLGDTENDVLKRYEEYAFTKELEKQKSWKDFLDLYLNTTVRKPRKDIITGGESWKQFSIGSLSKPTGAAAHKPTGASGASCTCPSIKNFPTVKEKIKGKPRTMPQVAMSKDLDDQEAELDGQEPE